MIGRPELQDLVREWGLREETVEKDYAIGWMLWGIGNTPEFTRWAFKGGTCLKKCYVETYRFSEDLDFTVVPDGPSTIDEIEPLLRGMLERVQETSGLDVMSRPPRLKERRGGDSLEGRVYYRGPRGAPQPSAIKLDITIAERLVRPTVLREVVHPYSDRPTPPGRVRCYAFDELFAEKIRAMAQRCRPRDLYDIINLFRRADLRAHPDTIRAALEEKCAFKGIPVPTAETIVSSPHRAELEAEWANMLGHQLPTLPPIAGFLDELESLFAWLLGLPAPEPLPVLRSREQVTDWAPPPTIWTWGEAVPIESVRYAAANHLCVELGYQGKKRVIEPYSLRRSRAGNLLLMSIRVQDRGVRSYRVDQIESIKVTNIPFTPVHPIEFAARGAVHAPPVERASRRTQSGPYYIVECNACGRQFRRKRRNTSMRPHKDASGWRCPGRSGHVVEHVY